MDTKLAIRIYANILVHNECLDVTRWVYVFKIWDIHYGKGIYFVGYRSRFLLIKHNSSDTFSSFTVIYQLHKRKTNL